MTLLPDPEFAGRFAGWVDDQDLILRIDQWVGAIDNLRGAPCVPWACPDWTDGWRLAQRFRETLCPPAPSC